MSRRILALAAAVVMSVAVCGAAAAQPAYGSATSGCTAYGYYGGWGYAPPASAPYPACNTIPSFATSEACMGKNCPPPPGLLFGWALGPQWRR